ncbi:MAG: UbiD family decarboxylase, partial [Deltaproteobacteria bacterium]|nr:UbiD family decarboxylase [Deltaproteobacteria bacterium]
MAFRDLREFIDRLDQQGELLRIKDEVDWHLEMGAIGRRALDLRAPAPLFENVKGYPPGYRVVAGLTGGSTPSLHARVALSLGLPPDTSPQDLVETFCQRTERPLPPVRAAEAPCQE